ncbi:uncharacterized protein LOC123543435 [Mercenaria mercenaria]|uniref:uncharacterized protein LOC123543435 n=1 Tax=Mercenaria mercenaria TaxID=6596 RepID=UPI00234F720F|nr:uncharacterized protein LOC123543435 [Mercenaria mercenaria]
MDQTGMAGASEFAFSPYYMYLFKKATRKGTEKDRTIRVNIVGNHSQGKTSLAKRLVGQTCVGVESTNGIDINRYRCKKVTNGEKSLAVVKNENQDYISRLASLARTVSVKCQHSPNSDLEKEKPVVKRAKVEELTNTSALSHESYEESITDDHRKPAALKNTTTLSADEFKSFSTEIDQGNNQSDIVIDFWDFGGEYSFYATHTVFHSRKALYLSVFDLSSPLDSIVKDEEFPGTADDKNMEDYARFWIESIHYLVGPEPPVILVGTHSDMLDGDELAKIQAKDEYFDKVRCLFDSTEMIYHIQSEDFAVDNNDVSEAEYDRLLQTIVLKGLDMVKSSEIPGRWIVLEKRLNSERHRKIITFSKVTEVNDENEYPLEGDEELKLFLHYHHEKGSLLYFDEEPISQHIVLDPKYLVDAFRCIITPVKFRMKTPHIREAWRILTTEGKLTDSLIDKVWDHNFMEHKHILLAFLKKHNIISQVEEYDEQSQTSKEQDWYVIPSLLQDHVAEQGKLLCQFLDGKSQTQIRYLMQFEKPNIVPIVYHRFLAAALGKWPVVCFGAKKMLFKSLGIFKLSGTYAGIAEMTKCSIQLQVCNLAANSIDSKIPDEFRRFAESVVKHEFTKLKHHVDEKVNPFSRKYRCNHRSHDLEGSHVISEISHLEEREAMLCPDNHSHSGYDPRKALAEWFLDKEAKMAFPRTILSDQDLGRLAQSAIGCNWEFLGLALGLSKVAIDHVKADDERDIMRIFKMLLEWKESVGGNATLDDLAKASKKCCKVFIDWDEIRNIGDTLEGTEKCVLSVSISESEASSGSPIKDTAEDQKPLEFIRNLKDQHVEEKPCTVVFECELNKMSAVQWFYNNHQIVSSDKYVVLDKGRIHTLRIMDVCDKDEGKYCVDVNGQKSEASIIIEETDEEKELLNLANLYGTGEYGDIIFDNCTVQEKDLLEKVQYEAARIVTGATKLVSLQKLMNEVGWESLGSRRQKHKTILFGNMALNDEDNERIFLAVHHYIEKSKRFD